MARGKVTYIREPPAIGAPPDPGFGWLRSRVKGRAWPRPAVCACYRTFVAEWGNAAPCGRPFCMVCSVRKT